MHLHSLPVSHSLILRCSLRIHSLTADGIQAMIYESTYEYAFPHPEIWNESAAAARESRAPQGMGQ